MKINKSETELKDFLQREFKNSIPLKSFLGEISLYKLNFDYDQFILTKQTKALGKNGILEVQANIRISSIDSANSKLEFSIKYTPLSVLLIVIFNLFISTVPFFVSNFKFFGSTINITEVSLRTLVVITGLVVTNFIIWMGFLIKKIVL